MFPLYDFDTYLDIETNSSTKHEFYQGHIYAMAGGTFNHAVMITAASLAFGRKLSTTSCFITSTDWKVSTPQDTAAFYPDLSIHCNQKPGGASLIAKSPTLVLEVLSASTRKYDLTTKRKEYFRIPSLRHYLLLDSESIHAILYTREPDQTWPKEPLEFKALTDLIPFSALNISLKLKDLYRQTDLLN